jgi:putative endonuclease
MDFRKAPKAGIQEKPMWEKHPAVYILASKRNGTLLRARKASARLHGCNQRCLPTTIHRNDTSDLARRVWEHKSDLVEGFTQKYSVHMLVHYEWHDDMRSAIIREKQIKKWNRTWKLRLIERENPGWRDLSDEPF